MEILMEGNDKIIIPPSRVARADVLSTGIQEVAGSILWSDNNFSWRLVMK